MKKIYQTEYHFLFVLIMSIFIYWPILGDIKFFDIDYNLVIEPLSKVDSLSSYIDMFGGNKLLDIQPIRDLAILSIVNINEYFEINLFPSFNFVIWLLICLVFYKMISLYLPNKLLVFFYTLILMSHPLLSWVITWPTAIKHLISVLFITLATFLNLKDRINNDSRNDLKIILFYFFSILSQPITILWFFWFLFQNLKTIKLKRYSTFLLLLITFTLVSSVNFFYYQKIYPLYVGVDKIQEGSTIDLINLLFSFSRSLSQVLIPISFSANYNINSILSFLGLPIFLLIFYLLTIQKKITERFILFFFILYPLILININKTNIFVSDTYLLIPLINFSIFLIISLNQFSLFNNLIKNKFYFIFLTIIFGCFSFKTNSEIKTSIDENQYYKMSYLRDANCKNAFALANHYLKTNDQKLFIKVADDTIANNCYISGGESSLIMLQIYAFRIFMDSNTNVKEKLVSFEKINNFSPSMLFLKSLLHLENQEIIVAKNILTKIKYPEIYIHHDILNEFKNNTCRKHSCLDVFITF